MAFNILQLMIPEPLGRASSRIINPPYPFQSGLTDDDNFGTLHPIY